LGIGAITSVVAVGVAAAAPVTINDVDLTGPDSTTWDAANDEYAYCTPAEPDGAASFTPVDEGYYGATSDAVDGGLTAVIDGKGFADPNGKGTQKGQTLAVGPTKVKGIKVRVREAALQGSPTLQVLYSFTNPGKHKVSPNVILGSNLGSDNPEGTEIAGTSNGDEKFQTADRWIVTTDGANSDPTVTHVFYGKGGGGFDKIVATPNKPCPPNGSYTDGLEVRYAFGIPAGETRYLLAFMEMGEVEPAVSLDNVKKFNDPKLSDKLLKGISDSVKRKIVNWDL
jgi:hypothetical protein